MYTPEDSPFEKFRIEKLKGVAMSPDVRELVALAYESGFIDGMQKQMQSSVDKAVNAMAQRQWVGLTDEEAQKAFAEHNCEISTHLAGILARAIKAKLKEKNA